ncbi:MAG: hypothetical protein H6Q89_234 [Myxococcaceae bacterium]|nr:hypothetical protein [Myxococcaceae bacterium]
MLRALLVLIPCVALGQPAAGAPAPEAPPAPAAPEVAAPAPAPQVEAPRGCARWKAEGLGEGPIALGYVEADVATGRRACPRSEVGIGGRLSAIIDTPAFYGYLLVDALVYGSVAIDPKTEIFGTLEAVHWSFIAQNGPLKIPLNDSATLGTLTLGATRQFYGSDRYLGAFSMRLLLPTSFAIPNTWLIGAELGHASSWRPRDWLELHGYLGVDFNTALGNGPTLPRVGGLLTAGVQLSPFSFLALVVDATGRLGAKSYFAPSVALRFRFYRLGIELAGTMPLAGTDRHDFIVGGRFTVRL